MFRYRLNILLATILTLISWPDLTVAKENHFTVVIDAGHGGKDVGAVDNNVKEKDINLGVALEVERLIKKELKDIKVIMTRDDDTYYTLQQRADKANKAKGDLFISIHTNSVDKNNKNRTTVSGCSVYALGLHKDQNNMNVARRENSVIELEKNYEQKYSGFDPNKDESYIIFEMAQKKNLSQSIKFANAVQKQLVKDAGRRDRGVHQAGFWVLWATSMPAVLIELDFICNPNSAKFLGSPQGQNLLAKGIVNAIKGYKDNNKRGGTRTSLNTETTKASDATTIELAASSQKQSVKTDPPASHNTNTEIRVRRRRSEKSRRLSGQRSVETASIPLHTESKYTYANKNADEETVKTENPIKDKPDTDKKKDHKKRHVKKSDHKAKIERFITVYKIQVLASSEELRQGDPRFCGLAPIFSFKENNLIKYTYGESQNKNEITALLKKVREKIPDAFVISMKKNVSSK